MFLGVRQASYAKKTICRILGLQQRKYPRFKQLLKGLEMTNRTAYASIAVSVVTMILIVVNFQLMS